MTTKRFFSGARDNTRRGEAFMMKKWEIMKGGKLPLTNAERYKRILKKKTQEHLAKAQANQRHGFMLPGAKAGAGRTVSKKTEQALKEIARRKALKEEKEMRQMVVVKPKRYYDSKGYFGRTDAKGNVYDEMENIVLKVDLKKGKVKTLTGWSLGKYRPKKMMHTYWMGEWVRKFSPYHIKLRQLELQRQVAAMYAANLGAAGMVTVHGMAAASAVDMHVTDAHGNTSEAMLQTGQRTNLGVTAWGVMSSNVHGTFGENVHGGFADNVWGRASTNIWGGIGDTGGVWGSPGRKIWGSGSTTQKNYIGIWGGLVASLMGFHSKRAQRLGREASATLRNAHAAAGSAPRAGGRR